MSELSQSADQESAAEPFLAWYISAEGLSGPLKLGGT